MKQLLLGFHAVQTRLRVDPQSIQSVYYDPARRDRRMADFIKQAEPILGKRLYSANAERLHNLAGHDRHQGIVAMAEGISVARTLPELLDSLDVKSDPPLLLVLDGITDPRNLGACLRVADAAGVHAVIAPKDRAVGLTDVAAKTASGAAETVPYVMVTNLARTLRILEGDATGLQQRREGGLRRAIAHGQDGVVNLPAETLPAGLTRQGFHEARGGIDTHARKRAETGDEQIGSHGGIVPAATRARNASCASVSSPSRIGLE